MNYQTCQMIFSEIFSADSVMLRETGLDLGRFIKYVCREGTDTSSFYHTVNIILWPKQNWQLREIVKEGKDGQTGRQRMRKTTGYISAVDKNTKDCNRLRERHSRELERERDR